MRQNRVIGGTLLIAGTAIGAGMIALPIASGKAGFFPTLILLVACWIYLTTTAFLFLEATLWLERDVNIVTMAEHTLGIVGKIISWFVYLLLLYALMTAYLSGCGALFLDSIQAWFSVDIPFWIGPLPFLLLFGLCVYLGTKPVDYINRALMLGLVITYTVLGFILVPHVDAGHLIRANPGYTLSALSIAVTSFGFHIVIPSLSYYLGYKKDLLKKTLIIGSCIPLVIYILWELFILGTLPEQGANSIAALVSSTNPQIKLLSVLGGFSSWAKISEVMRFFSYFAILTSFLGVSLSLSDFLADGFNIKKTNKGRFFIALMTFLPPLFFSLVFPGVFMTALKYGAIFVAILLGILPAVMVWAGRYRMNKKSEFKVIGGKALLIGVIVISLAVIVIDLMDQI